MREFLKSQWYVFLLCDLFISLDMAVMGLILKPDAQTGYWVLFFPPLYAFLCTIPSLFMYSKKELTVKQAIFRRILQIVSIEAIIIGLINGLNTNVSFLNSALLGGSVLVVFGAVWFVNWLRVRSEAKELNKRLEILNRKLK